MLIHNSLFIFRLIINESISPGAHLFHFCIMKILFKIVLPNCYRWPRIKIKYIGFITQRKKNIYKPKHPQNFHIFKKAWLMTFTNKFLHFLFVNTSYNKFISRTVGVLFTKLLIFCVFQSFRDFIFYVFMFFFLTHWKPGSLIQASMITSCLYIEKYWIYIFFHSLSTSCHSFLYCSLYLSHFFLYKI